MPNAVFAVRQLVGHRGWLVAGNRVLSLSEGPEVALFELATQSWTGSEVLAWTGSTVARWTPPSQCPISVPGEPRFEPPAPWAPVPSDERTAWIGTERLWTVVDIGEHSRRKSVWWSADFAGVAAESSPGTTLTVVYENR